MSEEELIFASTDQALQHLANITGKRIKIAELDNDVWDKIKPVIKTKGEYEVEMELWEDPGDYPSGAGGAPLPSEWYIEGIKNDSNAVVHMNLPEGYLINDSFEIIAPDGKKGEKDDIETLIAYNYDINDLFDEPEEVGDPDLGKLNLSMKLDETIKPKKVKDGVYSIELEIKEE